MSRFGMILALVAWSATMVGAQQPAAPAEFPRITVMNGRSYVLTTDFEVERLSVTNPAVADAMAITPREILIDGKGTGTVSLILWGADRRLQYDVTVTPATSPLQQQLRAIFPDENISASVTDEAIVLTGQVSSADVALRAAEVAQASSSKLKVLNLLQHSGGAQSQQVMLEVRFAEVERNALMELGTSFLVTRERIDARTTTQQFAAPFHDYSRPYPIVVPDYLNLFFSLNREGLLGTIRALQARGLFQSLAEPTLFAYNGQEASFLAGGEFPIPLVQGNTNSVTVEYKEFGVRLTFKPTISGDLIRLHVRPEVSTIDPANGITLNGFRIPGLKTRRAETDVELRDGQVFAIAGLLNNEMSDDNQRIPWLGSVPIVGRLFRSSADRARRTELLVLITPHLVRPLEPSEVPPLPVDSQRFLKPGDGLGSSLEGGGGLVDAPPVKPEDGVKR